MNTISAVTDAEMERAKQEYLRQVVAPNASDMDFAMLAFRSKELDLNPLNGEIFCIKYSAKKDPKAPAQIVVSQAGLIKLAHRTGKFNGLEADVIRDDDGRIIAAYASVYVKNCEHPFTAKVYMSEYDPRRPGIWTEKPGTMLKKVAISQAIRLAFDLSGVYTEEEFGGDGSVSPAPIIDADGEQKKAIRNTAPVKVAAVVDAEIINDEEVF